MALQHCPSCKRLGLTWYEDDKMRWGCMLCSYDAAELAEGDCPHCGRKGSYLLLEDKETQYHYCLHCHERRKA
jgi:Zn ribbon nucleic-acid-binding protein